MTVALPLSQWQELGVRLPDGGPLPTANIDASMVSGATRRFLVYHNYDALLEYNCANAYALGVALLADRIAMPGDAAAVSGHAKTPSPQKPRRTRR